MRINYNVSASIANKNLLGIESNLSQSMERLSSGLKINHAKDNPAGMAISRKMKAQIDGLDRHLPMRRTVFPSFTFRMVR